MVTFLTRIDLSNARRRAVIYSYLLNKKLSRRFRRRSQAHLKEVLHGENGYDSHVDDLPLTINPDPQPNMQ